MSINQQEGSIERQSAGCDPKTTKRNSGIFSFLRWFKLANSRDSVISDILDSPTGSCDSLNSTYSTGTVASFSFVPPTAYKPAVVEKSIALGPETDTYKARLKQRDKRREKDKNTSLRKKYNLFFSRDTINRQTKEEDEDNSKSLPLMTRKTMESENEKMHRRTNSESSKLKKAGSYCHVKGKRKAPQPPGNRNSQNGSPLTTSLRRKKRLAPQPPIISAEKVMNTLENGTLDNTTENIQDYAEADVLFNDSLKLDHGILKSTKKIEKDNKSPKALDTSSYAEAPVSPKPWYKRNTNRESGTHLKKDKQNKYEPVEPLPDVQFTRNSSTDLQKRETKQSHKDGENRKSGMMFLKNISELDREASEIIKHERRMNELNLQEMPAFMRPKAEDDPINTETLTSPKRKSARDLIAKFNAITNVTKVTVNTAFFGSKESYVQQKDKRDYFGRQLNKSVSNEDDNSRSKANLNDDNKNYIPLSKSESVSAIKPKLDPKSTPKSERKSWHCPKCFLENDYWRIICYVCSTIKPYFDDLTAPPAKNASLEKSYLKNNAINNKCGGASGLEFPKPKQEFPNNIKPIDRNFERSKTQIGFSALARYNSNAMRNKGDKQNSVEDQNANSESKKDEKEKLKKILIEMKNSLPKKKLNVAQKNDRASIIAENPDESRNENVVSGNNNKEVRYETALEETGLKQKNSFVKSELSRDDRTSSSEEKEEIAEIIVATTETIYENIKMKRSENPKPVKVSSSAQTSAVLKKHNIPPVSLSGAKRKEDKTIFHLIRPKDFMHIYNDKTGNPNEHMYANLAKNDDMSLFFNMPKRFSEIKNNFSYTNNTDTLEINRLLRRLETAIAKGELSEAAIFARELAQLKINCSVIRQKSNEELGKITQKDSGFTVELFVEDKISHRGPFPINVTPKQTVLELKEQVEKELEIPVNVQRWILGKELAVNDKTTLEEHNISTSGCPIFLYLVAPINDNNIEIYKHKQNETNPKEQLEQVLKNNLDKNNKKEDHSIKTPIPSGSKICSVNDQLSSRNLNITKQPTNITNNVSDNHLIENHTIEIIETGKNGIEKKDITRQEIGKAEPQKQVTEIKSNVSVVSATKKILDGEPDYDSKTLKPDIKDWECKVCTFINPQYNNLCSICANVKTLNEPSTSGIISSKTKTLKHNLQVDDEHYLQLVNLDNADLVENIEPFECLICMTDIQSREGVTLRECLHQFCKLCLAHTVEFNDEAEVKCPYRDNQYSCDIALQDREIKALVSPVVYDLHLAKSVTQAENKTNKSFHCKTPDCKGWCIFEDNVNEFRCPVCRKQNCLTCQAIHTGMNCRQYQESIKLQAESNDDVKQTKQMLDEMVKKGEALICPACQVVLMKKWGCDWVRCSMCKTEICWVTRGPRWGPAGKGDTTGGCKCGINGVKCHPQCNYCH